MTLPNPEVYGVTLDASEIKILLDSLITTLSQGQFDLEYLRTGPDQEGLTKRVEVEALYSKLRRVNP